jgi:hypothetical protein
MMEGICDMDSEDSMIACGTYINLFSLRKQWRVEMLISWPGQAEEMAMTAAESEGELISEPRL